MARKRRMDRVWMRLGDQGDYEDFDSPWDAGYGAGRLYEEHRRLPKVSKHTKYGVEIDPGFTGPFNYVSLFWGDGDAQPTRDVTASDIVRFRAGLAEGADIQVAPRRVRSTSRTKGRGRNKVSGEPTGLRAIR